MARGLGLGVLCVYVCVCAADSLINMEPLERSEQRCRELMVPGTPGPGKQ